MAASNNAWERAAAPVFNEQRALSAFRNTPRWRLFRRHRRLRRAREAHSALLELGYRPAKLVVAGTVYEPAIDQPTSAQDLDDLAKGFFGWKARVGPGAR